MKSIKTLIQDPWWTIDPVRDSRYVDWEGEEVKSEIRRRFMDQIIIKYAVANFAEEYEVLRDRCVDARPTFCGRQLRDLEGLISLLDIRAKEARAIGVERVTTIREVRQ